MKIYIHSSMLWIILFQIIIQIEIVNSHLHVGGGSVIKHKVFLGKDATSSENVKENLDKSKNLNKIKTNKNKESFNSLKNKRTKNLKGKFLHITDIHPDPFYVSGTDLETTCHRGKGRAGELGAEVSDCDIPYNFVNITFNWIKENIIDDIDFIIWTGDNVRHDRDRRFPRTQQFIIDENIKITNMFRDLCVDHSDPFKRFKIPLVTTLGNNDVFPHNMLLPGPNTLSTKYLEIWRDLIPEEQHSIFRLGSYYFIEVIPNKLAVISYNSLYMFLRNPIIDGCDEKSDPGYHMFKWLTITLTEFRKRGMKVWISSHVPPVKKNIEKTCLRKLSIWLYEFRDIIIGGLYGHMNIDHFVALDPMEAYGQLSNNPYKNKIDKSSLNEINIESQNHNFLNKFHNQKDDYNNDYYNNEMDSIYNSENVDGDYNNDKEEEEEEENDDDDDDEVNILGKMDYMDSVFQEYSRLDLTQIFKDFGVKYPIQHINPSVLTTFLPTLRVWEYNVTELNEESNVDNDYEAKNYKPWNEIYADFLNEYQQEMNVPENIFKQIFEPLPKVIEFDHSSFRKDKEWVDNNLKFHDEKKKKKKKRKQVKKPSRDKSYPPLLPEDTIPGPGYMPNTLFTPIKYDQYFFNLSSNNPDEYSTLEYEKEYSTDEEPYNLSDLTVSSWLGLIERFLTIKDFKIQPSLLWNTYVHRAFVSTGIENS